MPLDVLQLSDTHLMAAPDGTLLGCATYPALQAVVKDACRKPSDLALLTGDLSQDGTAASYEALATLLKPLGVPCYGLPGNHDEPRVMADTSQGAPLRLDRSFSAGGWRFLLLDSSIPGEVHGHLSDETLRWVAAKLQAHPNIPTLIALHHPPVPVGSAWLDALGLHEPEALLDLIATHPEVRLVLFGHIHQEFSTRHAQAHLYACPATSFQFKPASDTFTLDEAPAGYRRLRLYPDGNFETVVTRVAHTFTPDPEVAGY